MFAIAVEGTSFIDNQRAAAVDRTVQRANSILGLTITRHLDERKSARLTGVVDLSRQVRRHLDQAGLTETRIFASGDLDEFIIAGLLARGAQIDTFGVGTALATSEDAPALGGVYKLVDVASGETLSGLAKFSEEKIPRPNCCSAASCVKASASRPHRTSSRSATAPVELSRLPEPCRRLQNPAPYPVHFSCELEALLEDLRHGLTQPAGKKGA